MEMPQKLGPRPHWDGGVADPKKHSSTPLFKFGRWVWGPKKKFGKVMNP